MKSIDSVLQSAQVASLAAIFFPTLFKYLSQRFENARKAFDDTRCLMKIAISEHIQKRIPKNCGDGKG